MGRYQRSNLPICNLTIIKVIARYSNYTFLNRMLPTLTQRLLQVRSINPFPGKVYLALEGR